MSHFQTYMTFLNHNHNDLTLQPEPKQTSPTLNNPTDTSMVVHYLDKTKFGLDYLVGIFKILDWFTTKPNYYFGLVLDYKIRTE